MSGSVFEQTKLPPNQPVKVDELLATLNSWVELAGRSESLACQARYAIIFGMTTFILAGVTALHRGEYYWPACGFGFLTIICELLLNYRLERRTRSWNETLQVLTNLQRSLLGRNGPDTTHVYIWSLIPDLSADNYDKATLQTPYQIAKEKRDDFRVWEGDWPTRILWVLAGMTMLWIFILATEGDWKSNNNPTEITKQDSLSSQEKVTEE